MPATTTITGGDDAPEPIWSGQGCPECGSHRTVTLFGKLTCVDEATCWPEDSDQELGW